MKEIKRRLERHLLLVKKERANEEFKPCDCGKPLPLAKKAEGYVVTIVVIDKKSHALVRYRCPNCEKELIFNES